MAEKRERVVCVLRVLFLLLLLSLFILVFICIFLLFLLLRSFFLYFLGESVFPGVSFDRQT